MSTWSAALYGRAGDCDKLGRVMKCRLCSWLCNRFCPPDANSNFWRAVHDWEEDFAFDWEPAEQGDVLRTRWDEAKSLLDENPAAALAIHLQLAEGGSPFSMLRVGWHYEGGRGTERDAAAAEEYYRRALCAVRGGPRSGMLVSCSSGARTISGRVRWKTAC